MKLVNIGFGNFVSLERVVSIIGPDSAPLKRMIQRAREEGKIIDATFGRKTRSIINLDSDQIVLSALQPETLVARIDPKNNEENEEENNA
ncbi:MAG: DUF370 domain-containing protein [Gallicola sp.]|uniref:DUF370 domain-containing protein n=1 Tax=Gallicola sp. Sow4_E12 TaxID=3438785 RepID=UPI0018555CAA|nr:DUF370 domain-containing protein [Gallicola sp.]